MKVLNGYAGIGGNRKHWGSEHDITAVEIDSGISEVYKSLYPGDNVITGDAHKYLLNHYDEYDFIWMSPPCPSHGQYRYNVGVKAKGYKPVYPDMTLYEEIIFLQYHAAGKWAIENTVSYYDPLILPQKVGRHYIWANFHIPYFDIPADGLRDKSKISEMEALRGVDLSAFDIPNKRQILRNCTDGQLGLHILEAALNIRPSISQVQPALI